MSTSTIPYGGPTHILLRYAKMKASAGFTAASALKTFPNKFSRQSRVLRSAQTLLRNGLLVPTKDGWRITEMGVGYLHATAKKDTKED